MEAPFRPEKPGAIGPFATVPSATTAPGMASSPLSVQWIGPERQLRWTDLSVRSLRLGREPDNDVVLLGSEVSRHHAQIERRGEAVAIRDLGSRNGVFVTGERVELAPLTDGSVVRLGEWVGVVTRGSGELRAIATGLFGSARLEAALADVRRAAASPLGLLLFGETGTGKELVASAVHAWSGRRGHFVALSCAALPESLFEAELFGHERGAFTGAAKDRLGHIRKAQGGTLFLDEVGEMPLPTQAKLLRFLQEKQVMALGSSVAVDVDVRIVAATHRDLRAMAERGQFRPDLLARLEGVVVELPSLRARREDVYPLLMQFVRSTLGREGPPTTARFVESLLVHDWPGNVRELKATAERLAVLQGKEPEWHAHHLGRSTSRAMPAYPSEAPSARATGPVPVVPQLSTSLLDTSPRTPPKELGREQIVAALTSARGVVAEAARVLRISKQSLYTLMQRHGVDAGAFREPG